MLEEPSMNASVVAVSISTPPQKFDGGFQLRDTKATYQSLESKAIDADQARSATEPTAPSRQSTKGFRDLIWNKP